MDSEWQLLLTTAAEFDKTAALDRILSDLHLRGPEQPGQQRPPVRGGVGGAAGEAAQPLRLPQTAGIAAHVPPAGLVVDQRHRVGMGVEIPFERQRLSGRAVALQAGGRSAPAELCAQVQYAQSGVFDELEGLGRVDFALAFDQARGRGELDRQPVVPGFQAVCQLRGGVNNVCIVHGRGDGLHHAFARFHEDGGRVCQRVGGSDRFDGEAAAAAAFVFAADAAGSHAFCAQGQVRQVAQAVAEERDGKGERLAGCVAGPVVEGRADGIGPAQVAVGLLVLRHRQQLADGTDRRVQYAGLLRVGGVPSFRAEGTTQDAGERAPHRAALEGMP